MSKTRKRRAWTEEDLLRQNWKRKMAHATRPKKLRGRGISWFTPLDYHSELVKQPCAYCGAPPSNVEYPPGRPDLAIRLSGTDRVDSSRAYVPGNIVPCCSDCNTKKGDRNLLIFLAKVRVT
jgi:5-methylcytosine-specific restriction endonuclease McrA